MLDLRPDLWFFPCHFKGDPVMPGCLGLDALWQMVGFFLGWSGSSGRGRAIGTGEIKLAGQVLPTVRELIYGIDIKRVMRSKLVLGTADGSRITRADRCCGEAGTLAVTRPDIATQVRMRKEAELEADAARLHAGGFDGKVRVLTSCPACLQGLARFEDTSEVQADYLVVELAHHLLGANWMADFVARANAGGIERVLV